MKRLLYGLLWLVIAVASLPILLVAVLQVPAGRSLVSGVVSSLVSSPERNVELTGLSLDWSLDLALSGLRLADRDGIWLEASDIRVDWSPSRLFTGKIDIDTIAASRIAVLRQPVPAAATEAGDEVIDEGSDGSFPMLPVRLGALHLPDIVIGAPLVGEEFSLSANGSAALSDAPANIDAKLDINRTGTGEGTITAKVHFDPDNETLAFDLAVHEPRGGLVARLMDVQNLPALDLTLTGDGPLNNWAGDLGLALDGEKTVTGRAKLAQSGVNRRLDFDLDGLLSPLMPDVAAAFFIGTTDLTGTATLDAGFKPVSADIKLATRTLQFAGQGSFDVDTQRVDATAALKVSAGDNHLIALELPDRRLAFGPLSINTSVSGSLDNARWNMDMLVSQLATREGRTGETKVKLSGSEANLIPETFGGDFALQLAVKDFSPTGEKLTAFSGNYDLTASGTISGSEEQISLSTAQLTTPVAGIDLESAVLSPEKASVSGKAGIGNLAAFSPLAGRELDGSIALTFQASGDPEDQTGTVNLSANSRNLVLGIDQIDSLLTGVTTLTASADVQGLDAIQLTALTLKAEGIDATGHASMVDKDLSANLSGTLPALAYLHPDVSGAVAFKIDASGPLDAPNVKAEVTSASIFLAGTPLDDFRFDADVTASATEPEGRIETSGLLNGAPLSLTADLSSADGQATIDNLNAEVDGNRITGKFHLSDLARAPESLSGDLTIDAPTLSALSPLVLRPIGGSLQGKLTAVASNGSTQTVSLELKGNSLSADGLEIGELTADAEVATPFLTSHVNGSLLASKILAGTAPIHSLKLDAVNQGTETDFKTAIVLTDGTSDGLTAKGRLLQFADTLQLSLSRLDGSYQGLKTSLKEPASLTYGDAVARIESLTLALGSGALSVSGTAGDQLDITAKLTSVPLTLANAFAPKAGVGGTLSGTAALKGASSEPVANWSLTANSLTAAALSQKGLPTLNVVSTGEFSGGLVAQKTTVSGPDNLSLTSAGKIGVERPQSLNLTLNGDLPLAFLRRPLTEAGLRAQGGVVLSGTVSGTLANPEYALKATPRGISITELSTALTLQDVTGSVDVTPAGISLTALNGKLASGGSVAVSGTVGLGPNLEANIQTVAKQARYTDPGLVTALVNADVSVTGPLASASTAALISGAVTIEKADVSIPETLPGSVSPIAVKHLNAPKAVRQQMADLGADQQTASGQTTASLPPRLDVKVSAPGRIFIRGRGLDAELFGDLTIAGTTADPQAIGAFTLRRGQMDILTRRLAFSRGSATFYGSLTPVIDFLATTSVSGTTINLTVQGPADDPVIGFSSSPELPQDEVLALLLFGKEMGSLSPSQIAQLAAAISTLTGGNDNGPLARIRKSLGLDAIDIQTGGENGPSIGVGKYVNDNIYLGVEQGTGDGSSRVKVDIDLNRGVKVRGEVGADGSSKAGIFFEKEY